VEAWVKAMISADGASIAEQGRTYSEQLESGQATGTTTRSAEAFPRKVVEAYQASQAMLRQQGGRTYLKVKAALPQ